MWEKHFRFLVFNAIYNTLFWEGIESDKYTIEENIAFSKSNINNLEEDIDINEIVDKLKLHFEKKEEHKIYLQEFLPKWDKTYVIVKAIFYTFMIEKEESEDLSNIIGKYIRLTQEMVGGESTSLVHAVLSKVSDK